MDELRQIEVNGKRHSVAVDTETPPLWILREEFGHWQDRFHPHLIETSHR